MNITISDVLQAVAVVLTIACAATVYLIQSLHRDNRKMQAAYFLNAGRVRFAWNTIFIATIAVALQQVVYLYPPDETLGRLSEVIVTLVLFVGVYLLYAALSRYRKKGAAPAPGK
ncbi:MAG: hypothetical protein NTY90_04580 [Candidatus Micrarchaeota archaeon]|nr:hypothetical protein [Candidatus Micrarchaeota archaeon]